MDNSNEIFNQPVATVNESVDLKELVEAVEWGIKKLEEKNVESAELRNDLKILKLIFDWQIPLSEIEKIKNQAIRDKISGFRDGLIKLGALVDTISKVPNTHFRKHEAGWRISHIHPDGKTVDLARGMDVSSDVKTRIVKRELERRDNVPIEDITFSKTEDPFING
jgi:hypothetical protein